MSEKRPDALDAYTNFATPDAMLVTKANIDTADEVVDTFFENVQAALGLGNVTYEELFERTKATIVSGESLQRYELQPDSVEVFKKRGGQVIASVLRMSEEPHTQTVRFHAYRLTDETDQAIRDLHYLERIHTA